MKTSTTDFGYQQVPTEQKVEKVKQVFDSVANRYDVMNDLMSLGLHRLWKRMAIDICGAKRGDVVLDIATGTGDLAKPLAQIVGSKGLVVCSDINQAMLSLGRDKLIDQGLVGNIEYVQADAQNLPFPAYSFDKITIGFGLRNVTDKLQALTSMCQVLKPGGKALILEFSHPRSQPLKTLYDVYSFQILPLMGKIVAKDSESYRYLAESIRMHPDQMILQQMLEQAGFGQCDHVNLSGGIVAIHWGYKL